MSRRRPGQRRQLRRKPSASTAARTATPTSTAPPARRAAPSTPPQGGRGRISLWPLSGAGLTLVTLIVVGLVVGIVLALHSGSGTTPAPFGTPLPFTTATPSPGSSPGR